MVNTDEKARTAVRRRSEVHTTAITTVGAQKLIILLTVRRTSIQAVQPPPPGEVFAGQLTTSVGQDPTTHVPLTTNSAPPKATN